MKIGRISQDPSLHPRGSLCQALGAVAQRRHGDAVVPCACADGAEVSCLKVAESLLETPGRVALVHRRIVEREFVVFWLWP